MSSNDLLRMEMHTSVTGQTTTHPSPSGELVPLPRPAPWGGPEARNRVLDTAEVRQLVAESIRITDPDPSEYDQPAHYNNSREAADPEVLALFSREATEKFFRAGNH